MKINQLYALFRDFLNSEEKLSEKFWYNITKQGRYIDIPSLCTWNDADMLVYKAFEWKHTKEGFEFWADVNGRWTEFLKGHPNQ